MLLKIEKAICCSLLVFSILFFAQNVNASNWIPINVGDITIFIPDPSLEQLESNAYQQGSSVSISVGSVSSTQAFYFRQFDLSNNQYGAWQCSTASEVSTNGGFLEDEVLSGNYQYQVSACMTGNGCDLNKFQSGDLVCSENELSASIEVKDTSGIRAASTSDNQYDYIGTTAAQFRVTESGAAAYDVPISLPTGTAGVKPQISLSYSSQSGDGYMGRGWNISGMSGIMRCPKNFANDNKIDGVDFTKSDRLCLNGQRLILNGKTTDFTTTDTQYWATTAKYHTELDSFSYVTPHYLAGHLKGFTVQTKSGEIHYYGQNVVSTGNSLLGKPLTYEFKTKTGAVDSGHDAFVEINTNSNLGRLWALKAIRDVKNNYILYRYIENTAIGEHYISEIQYTGNTSTTPVLNPYAYVTFNYEENKKLRSGWQSGTPISLTKLLTSVEVKIDGHDHRSYDLAYYTSHFLEEKNYLESVTECVGSVCLKPTTFNWNKKPEITTNTSQYCNPYDVGYEDEPNCVDIVTNDPFVPFSGGTSSATSTSNYSTAKVFDINGDGFADIVYVEGSNWKVKLGPYYSTTKTLYTGKTGKPEYALIMDYDGDSVLDLLVANNTTDKWTILTYNATAFTQTASECYFNCVSYTYSTNSKVTTITATGLEGKTQILDVNGDTLSDIVMASGKSLYYYKNLGGGNFASASAIVTAPASSQNITNYDEQFIRQTANLINASALDVNGDGRSDILFKHKKTEGQCRLGTGEVIYGSAAECQDVMGTYQIITTHYWKLYVSTGTEGYSYVQTLSNNEDFNPRVADLNGDGLSDLVYRAGTSWNYMLSNGISYTSAKTIKNKFGQSIATSSNNEGYAIFADVSGDGRTDLLMPNSNASKWNIYFSRPMSNNPLEVGFESRGSYAFNKNRSIQFGDVNGDGKLDLLQSDGSWYIKEGGLVGQAEDVIDEFINGFGIKTHIGYANITSDVYYNNKSSTQYTSAGALNHDFVSPKSGYFVVGSAATDSNTGSLPNAVQYQYGGLLVHKNGRGMLGFERLRTKDLQTCGSVSGIIDLTSCMTTETVYSQTFPFIGMPLETRQTLGIDGPLISLSTNTLNSRLTEYSGVLPFVESAIETSYVLDATLKNSSALNITDSVFTYDQYGNQLSSSITEKNPSSPDDDYRITLVSNVYGGTAKNMRFGRLSSTNVIKSLYAGGSLSPNSSDGTSARTSHFTYNSDLMLLTETVEQASVNFKLVTTHGYDKFGNQVLSNTKGASGFGEQTRSSSSSYNSRGRYVETATDALGHTSNFTRIGTIAGGKGRITQMSSTSANNITTTSWADVFGRTYKKQNSASGANDPTLESQTLTAYCSTTVICPAGTYYRIVEIAAGTPEKQSFFDKWGRNLQSQVKTFDNKWSITKQTYDSQGQLKLSFEPGKTAVSSYKTEYTYDRLRRVVAEDQPRGQISRIYGGSTIKTTDVNGLIQSETRNYLGQLEIVSNSSKNGVTETLETQLKYQYNAHDQLLNANVFAGATFSHTQVNNEYNSLGHKVGMTDLDKGNWSYVYNAFGELISQTQDDDLLQTTLKYDVAGRKISRLDSDGFTDWQYDNGSYAKGKLTKVRYYKDKTNATGAPNIQESYFFASHGKSTSTDLLIDGEEFSIEQSYDEFNRLYYTTYPANNFTIKQTYTSLGYADSIVNSTYGHRDFGKVYQKVTAMNHRGQVTGVDFANGVNQTSGYDANTGWLSSLNVSKGGTTHHSLIFMYDDQGNLKSRDHDYSYQTSAHDFEETFFYDDLNRLDYRSLKIGSSTTTQDYDYDARGNIIKKQGTGYYKYDATKKNRLKEVWTGSGFTGTRTNNFSYDNRGNVTNDGQRSFSYSSFDKPYQITKGTTASDFYYGPSRELYRQKLTKAGQITDTLYVKGLYERVKLPTGVTEHKYNVGNVVVTDRSNDDNDTLYLHKDSQGSTISITDHNGDVVQLFTYDPWGKQSAFSPQPQNGLAAYVSPAVSQGYTGHKMINDIGIIHMNGRIYDPMLGRFLQADPHIQAPNNSQSYNRYSYVLNNPLSYTDPSGYFFSKLWKKIKPFVSVIVGAVLVYATGGTASWFVSSWYGSATLGAIAGASGAAANGGNILKGALVGAFSAAAFYGVGQAFDPGTFGNIVGNGAVGGVLSDLQGGNFGHGFFAAGFSAALKPTIYEKFGYSPQNAGARVATAAVIGGTASVISGGKFANGATSAAFSQLLNGENYAKKSYKTLQSLKSSLSDEEWQYLEDNKLAAPGIASATKQAFDKARELYPTSLHNGEGDAFRHAYWNALITRYTSAGHAEAFTTLHEQIGGGPAIENSMDMFNNAAGRSIALETRWTTVGYLPKYDTGGGPNSLQTGVLYGLNTGGLKYIQNGKLVTN